MLATLKKSLENLIKVQNFRVKTYKMFRGKFELMYNYFSVFQVLHENDILYYQNL